MKILVVSDTHGHDKNLERVLYKVKPVDALIHCGDVEGMENHIRMIAECPCYLVRGNNDYFSDLPREEMITLGGYKIMITHGHMYGVSMDMSMLEEEARSREVQIVMFGHTHRPFLEQKKGLTLLNPGSLSYPRQAGRKPSFLIMEIDKNGEVHYTQNVLEW
ncbi:MAG: metallophosphoesterase [Clostridia bacterium]|nr:metallophosphoesterase [Clostridia bacterium]NCC44150.1 metallophosphoesterase [Clostridia bacterium]